jgi:uncharacterized phosphosugar-binding protein
MSDLPEASLRYVDAVRSAVAAITANEATALARAVELCADAAAAGRTIYLFGTGHSHVMAEEGHHRAGGLACVCPILAAGLMLHEGAESGTLMERTPGVAAAVLARYPIQAGDVLIVFSNSGVNTVPVEAALAGKDAGAVVIAVLAAAYAATVPTGPVGRKLADVADLVIDNHGPPGDAAVAFEGSPLRSGPLSTVTGALILNAILVGVVERLIARGIEPPVWISSNLPGAHEHNLRLLARYRGKNPHL